MTSESSRTVWGLEVPVVETLPEGARVLEVGKAEEVLPVEGLGELVDLVIEAYSKDSE